MKRNTLWFFSEKRSFIVRQSNFLTNSDRTTESWQQNFGWKFVRSFKTVAAKNSRCFIFLLELENSNLWKYIHKRNDVNKHFYQTMLKCSVEHLEPKFWRRKRQREVSFDALWVVLMLLQFLCFGVFQSSSPTSSDKITFEVLLKTN